MQSLLRAFFDLFFPPHCLACEKLLKSGEHMLCTICRHQLPVTNLHHTTQKPIHQLLYGRVEIEYASALFYFDKKSKVQHLIHNLKYRNHKRVSNFLGKWLGTELAALDCYKNIDCVMPVPLHKSKLQKRGYNQVTGFAQEIAGKLQIPMVGNVLYRSRKTKTQVFKSRRARASDVLYSFDIREYKNLCGKHILLVDDLITTGGTVEGCAKALLKIPEIKISIAVMAIA